MKENGPRGRLTKVPLHCNDTDIMLNFGCRNSKRMTTFTAAQLRPAARTAVCLSNAIVGEATHKVPVTTFYSLRDCETHKGMSITGVWFCPTIISLELANEIWALVSCFLRFLRTGQIRITRVYGCTVLYVPLSFSMIGSKLSYLILFSSYSLIPRWTHSGEKTAGQDHGCAIFYR